MCQNVSWVSQLRSRNRLWSGWHHTFLRKTLFAFFAFHPSINTCTPSPTLDTLRPLRHNELFPPFSSPAWQEGWKVYQNSTFYQNRTFCARGQEAWWFCRSRREKCTGRGFNVAMEQWGSTRVTEQGCWVSVWCQRVKMSLLTKDIWTKCQDWEAQLPPSIRALRWAVRSLRQRHRAERDHEKPRAGRAGILLSKA